VAHPAPPAGTSLGRRRTFDANSRPGRPLSVRERGNLCLCELRRRTATERGRNVRAAPHEGVDSVYSTFVESSGGARYASGWTSPWIQRRAQFPQDLIGRFDHWLFVLGTFAIRVVDCPVLVVQRLSRKRRLHWQETSCPLIQFICAGHLTNHTHRVEQPSERQLATCCSETCRKGARGLGDGHTSLFGALR
jgi:hypothetical protein